MEIAISGMNTTTGKHGIIPISFLTVKVPLAPTSSLYAAQSNTATAIYDYVSSTPGDLQVIKILFRNVRHRLCFSRINQNCKDKRNFFSVLSENRIRNKNIKNFSYLYTFFKASLTMLHKAKYSNGVFKNQLCII